MTVKNKLLLTGVAFMVILVVALFLAGPSLMSGYFYPKPRGLPQVVSESREHLLARLQAVLETNAPLVAASLQKGLSDTEISALEKTGGFQLPESLKKLYRWRNGMSTNSPYGLLPGQRFLPLDEFVRREALLRSELRSATALERGSFNLFAGYRKNWVQVFDDGASDGYFYDPKREEDKGAFFYHMAEARYYVWFPSLNNFLTGIIECYDQRIFKVSANGKELDEDVDRAQVVWSRLAKTSE